MTSYKYIKYLRNGGTVEVTALVRSKKKKKA